MTIQDRANTLAGLAAGDLGTLSDAERGVVHAVVAGEVAGPTSRSRPLPVVQAALIRWLCTGSTARPMIDPRGVRLRHSALRGDLDLSFVTVPFPLELVGCTCANLDLSHATVPRITLNESDLLAFSGEGMETGDDFLFTGGRARRGIRLLNSRIKGDLTLSGTELGHAAAEPVGVRRNAGPPERLALDLNGGEVDGSVFLNRHEAFRDGTTVEKRFRARGEVRLRSATVGENVECDDAVFSNPEGSAIDAQRIRVRGDFYLRRATVHGAVPMYLAKVEGALEADGAHVLNPGGASLDLYGASVAGHVGLRAGFRAEGTVKLVGTSVGGNLDCETSILSGTPKPKDPADRYAFNGNRMEVKGHVFFTGSELYGGATMLGASVGASLYANGARLLLGRKPERGDPFTLSAERLRVAGSIHFCERFHTDGLLNLELARVGANLSFRDAVFGDRERTGLRAEGLHVERELEWKQVRRETGTEIHLGHAYAGQLDDDPGSWGMRVDGSREPATTGTVDVDGFLYGGLSFAGGWRSDGDPNAPYWRVRVRWLEQRLNRARAPADAAPGAEPPAQAAEERRKVSFHPQPYDQLSTVLRRNGYEGDAREVEVEKGRAWRRSGSLGRLAWLRNVVLDWTLGYGWKPSQAVLWSLGVIVVGFYAYSLGAREGLMTPSSGRVSADAAALAQAGPGRTAADSAFVQVPSLSPLTYSVDVFLPIVDLQQEKYWHPNAHLPCKAGKWVIHPDLRCGRFLRWYHWFHILVGWALTTLAVIGFTGLVRK